MIKTLYFCLSLQNKIIARNLSLYYLYRLPVGGATGESRLGVTGATMATLAPQNRPCSSGDAPWWEDQIVAILSGLACEFDQK